MIYVAWLVLGGACAGLIAGSFIATLVIRWPKGKALDGRSNCDGCARTLGLIDLVPVVSFIVARGHCRTCGAAIDIRHPAMEVTAMLIGICATVVSPDWTGVAGAVFGWQLLALAALDVDHFWLPDRLTGLLAASGIAVALTMDRDQLATRIIGGVVAFAALSLIAFAYRRLRGRTGMGAGDPKLFGAIGLWLGWTALPLVLIAASFLGLAGAGLVALRGTSIGRDTRIPFGALMAVVAFPIWMVMVS